MIAAALASLVAVLPGLVPSYFLARRDTDLSTLFSRAVVLSLLLASAISWLPGGARIPLYIWLLVLLAMSIGGLVVAVKLATDKARRHVQYPILTAISLTAMIAFAVIVVTRAVVEWDAINYYLFAAVGMVSAGHYTNYFPQSIAFSVGAPNTVPPVLPILYAFAIVLAQVCHAQAEQAIRLIPLVFIAGIFASTLRIARQYLKKSYAIVAALIAILLPATVAIASSAALYLDLGFCFLTTQLLAELLEKPDDRYASIFFYLTASAAIIEKVDGLPYVVLLCLVAMLRRLSPRLSQVGFALLAIGMIGAGAVFKIFVRSATLEIYVFIALATALLIYAGRQRSDSESTRFNLGALGLVGLLPGAFYIVAGFSLTGSPAGYYIPSLATKQPAAWHHALAAILQANPYAANPQPGLPGNFGIGLLTWWGFGPPIMLMAIAGAFYVFRRRSGPLLPLQMLLAFNLAFLTVFGLDDFRHLFPIIPLLAVLSVYGLVSISKSTTTRYALLMVMALGTIPFAWVAQERFFSTPLDLLLNAKIDQWQQLSPIGVTNTILYMLAMCSIAAILLARERVASATETGPSDAFDTNGRATFAVTLIVAVTSILLFIFTGLTVLLLGALFAAAYGALPHNVRRTFSVTAAVIVGFALWFEPVVITAFAPGFASQRHRVENEEAQGIIPTLRLAFRDQSVTTIATFESYGVTWFSLGRVKRLELGDASDLSAGMSSLQSNGVITALQQRGIEASILPSRINVYYRPLNSLLEHIHSDLNSATYNPLATYMTSQASRGEWLYSRFLPATHLPLTERRLVTYRTTNSKIVFSVPHQLASTAQAEVTVLGYALADRAIFPIVAHLRLPISNDSFSLSYRDLTASALQQSDRNRKATLVIRSIAARLPDAKNTIAFSSEGLIVNGSGHLIKAMPLFINGRDSIVSGLELRTTNNGVVTSWPKTLADNDKPRSRARSVDLSLASSDVCPSGSPIELIATVEMNGSTQRYTRLTYLDRHLHLPFRDAINVQKANRIVIEVRGEGGCRIDEQIDSTRAIPEKHEPVSFAVRSVEVW